MIRDGNSKEFNSSGSLMNPLTILLVHERHKYLKEKKKRNAIPLPNDDIISIKNKM